MFLLFGHACQLSATCAFFSTLLVLGHQQHLSTCQWLHGVAIGLLWRSDMAHRVQHPVQPVFRGRRGQRRGRCRGIGEHGNDLGGCVELSHMRTMRWHLLEDGEDTVQFSLVADLDRSWVHGNHKVKRAWVTGFSEPVWVPGRQRSRFRPPIASPERTCPCRRYRLPATKGRFPMGARTGSSVW